MKIASAALEKARLLERAIIEIRDNGQNIETIFVKYHIDYKIKSYYALKKRYEENGIEGLISQKHKCGRKKKSQCEEYDFIISLKKKLPHLTAKQIQKKLKESLNIEKSKSQINRILSKEKQQNKVSTTEINAPKREHLFEETAINYAGLIFLLAAATETGFNDCFIDFQKRIISIAEDQSGSMKKQLHNEEDGVFSKDASGKFTTYNAEKRIKGEVSNRYKSVKARVKNRDLTKLRIVQTSDQTLIRKNLTVLCLPVITCHGRFAELNETLGNELSFFTGYDYRTSTIDKYMREQKYLQSSQILMAEMAGFWCRLWESKTADKIKQVCYYFDGNRKALWSRYSVKQSKVTMIGRVMGCLEQVYIHGANGHPIMFQTFSGGAHLPTAIKSLHAQMDRIIPHPVSRISIFDAAANSVDFYESFKDDEYFICVLDSNQYKQDLSDFEIISEKQTPTGLYIEAKKNIKNSKNKQFYDVRTPIYKKIGGERYIAFVTNIPPEVMDIQSTVISYYQRWPCQEHSFRNMNSGVDLRTNYGYGKTKTINVVVQNKKKYLHEQIKSKQTKIEKLTQEQALLKEDATHHVNTLLKTIKENGLKIDELKKQIEKAPPLPKLKSLLKQLDELYKQQQKCQISILKKEFQIVEKLKKFGDQQKRNESLKQKHEKELNRISGKEIVYENDVELDQLLGIYKISLANLSAFVLKEYFDGLTLSLEKLLNKIYKRPGKIKSTENKSEIIIYLSKKDKEMSELIRKACEKINEKGIILNNRLVEMVAVEKNFQNKKFVDEFKTNNQPDNGWMSGE